MLCGAERRERARGLNMDVLDHSEDEEERGSHIHCGGGARFGARWQKPRSKSHHQLLLMDSIGNGNSNGNGGVDGDGASEDQEILPLPDYERLSQSARLPDDPNPRNPLLPEFPAASPPPPPPLPRQQQKKPAAWRLIDYVRSRRKSGGPGSSDGDSRSSDGEKEGSEGGSEEGKKKRSSWLPDRRWPVQGFSGEEVEDDGGEEDKKEKNKKRSSWLPDREQRWPVQGFY